MPEILKVPLGCSLSALGVAIVGHLNASAGVLLPAGKRPEPVGVVDTPTPAATYMLTAPEVYSSAAANYYLPSDKELRKTGRPFYEGRPKTKKRKR